MIHENDDPRTSERIRRDSMDLFRYADGEDMERGDVVRVPSLGDGEYVIIGWYGTDQVIVIPRDGGHSVRVEAGDIR